ncbi:site-specific integrase [Caulobacter sp. 602-2]|uniref:Site-specific integrase n=1 Tax=Caulobacter sp. 602-2 TaxID=2710887 RepID=A0A6G4R434_9CAUL|nr:site-specific integrase [Caulobacter sp. 602-2]NGM51918.1 site-specific integrase [Caulobacter sp. 602-2]
MPKRTSLRLTKRIIDDAKPDSQTWDSEVPGFGVRRTAAGTRSFIYAYRTRSGQQRKMALGGYPALTVEAARSIAREHAVKIARGEDPAAERRAQRQAETLADMVVHYCDEYGPNVRLKARSIRDARQVLVAHALPKFGKTRIADFRPDDIRRIHGDAQDRAGPYQANRLLAALSRIFNLAIEQEVRATNPCKGVKKFPEEERWRNLSTEEVRRLLEACDRCPYEDGANAIRLLLFTGARLQEVLRAEWSMFDLSAGVWEKPSSHTKTKRLHRVELAGPSLDLLRRMRGEDLAGKYLFPGRPGGYGAVNPRTDLKRPWSWLIREAALSDVRLHDLRRTTASFMLDQNAPLVTIGKALGHTQVATTQRYAQLRSTAQRNALEGAGLAMVRSLT